MAQHSSPRLRSRVVVAPPGTGGFESAVRVIEELWHSGTEARVTTFGKVLCGVLRDRLQESGIDRGHSVVTTYHNYVAGLAAHRLDLSISPREVDDLTLWDLARRAVRIDPSASADNYLVVLQGQQLPAEFYLLLQLLGIRATVFVDPTLSSDVGASVEEITARLGCRDSLNLTAQTTTTKPIHRFGAELASWPRYLEGESPQRHGERPVVVDHETVEQEVDHVVSLWQTAASGTRILVAVPTRDLVTEFRSKLSPRVGSALQWYLSGEPVPRTEWVDHATPGIRLLTWQSATGMDADVVVLAGLHDVAADPESPSVRRKLRALTLAARRKLLLSYSGEGVPALVASLPMSYLDTQDPDEVLSVIDMPEGTDEPNPIFEEPDSSEDVASTQVADRVTGTEIAAGRQLIQGDRTNPRQRQRVLTRAEEVGLVLLTRGQDSILSEALPARYRADLRFDDERAIAFDALVVHNLGLIRSNLAQYRGSGLEEDDLQHHGVIGLMRAIERFDITMGTKFSTYATWWINQSINRGVANEGRAIRLPVYVHDEMQRVLAVRQRLLTSNGDASARSISQETELPVNTVVKHLLRASGVVSLDAPVGEDSLTLAELLPLPPNDSTCPEHVLDQRATTELVHRVLATLPPRQSEVLRLRFGIDDDNPRTLEQIGERVGVSRERIRQIESKAKGRVTEILTRVVTGTGEIELRESKPTPVAPKVERRPVQPESGSSSRGPASSERDELASGTNLSERLGEHRIARGELGLVLQSFIDQCVASGADDIAIELTTGEAGIEVNVRQNGRRVAGPVLEELAEGPGKPHPDGGSGKRAVMCAIVELFGEMRVWDTDGEGRKYTPVVLVDCASTGDWSLRADPDLCPPTLDEQSLSALHSVISLRAPKAPLRREESAVVADELYARIGIVLGDLVRRGDLVVRVNGRAVERRDPFLWHNPAAQDFGVERVRAQGVSVEVNPFVLPHPDELRPGDMDSVGQPEEWEATQGFYVRCGGRYVSCSGWLGLPDLESTPQTALARVAVEIPVDDRGAWGIDDNFFGVVSPPEAMRPRLAGLARLARTQSERVLGNRPKGRTE